MNKETQSIADKLLKKGEKVFVNEKNEIFTQENLAKNSGSTYKEYHNLKTSSEDDDKGDTGSSSNEAQGKPYKKENNETLVKMIEDRGLELGEAKEKKDFVAILEADDLQKVEAEKSQKDKKED